MLSVNSCLPSRLGYVVIGDKIKDTSGKAIKVLQSKGIEVVMLTGDNYNTAQAVASELNLTDFKASMLPEDKLKEVEKLQANGKVVAQSVGAVSKDSFRSYIDKNVN